MPDLRARKVLGYAAAFVLALLMVAPFLWMLSTALMDEFEVYQAPPPLLPSAPRFANFPEALTALPFTLYFRNSFILAAATVTGQVITAAMAGYAFARHRFAGRTPLFAVYLATLMIPGIALLVPRFLIVDAMGLVDTVAGLVSVELVAAWGSSSCGSTSCRFPATWKTPRASMVRRSGRSSRGWRCRSPARRWPPWRSLRSSTHGRRSSGR